MPPSGVAAHLGGRAVLVRPALPCNSYRRWLGTAPGRFPLERVRTGETPALLASFVHPAAPTRDNWGANDRQRYLRDTVTPTVAARAN